MAALVFQTGAADAHPNDVQIMRGGQPSSIIETQEAGVRVYRGTAVAKPAADAGRAAVAKNGAEAAIQVVTAGSRVWIVNQVTGRLSVCRVLATTQHGEHKIDCLARRL